VKNEGTLVLTQSAIGEINSATELQATIGNAPRASNVKSEGTLVLTQSAIGEISSATELQATIGNARRLPV
jgi:hypothetical protein